MHWTPEQYDAYMAKFDGGKAKAVASARPEPTISPASTLVTKSASSPDGYRSKTERRYADEILKPRLLTGKILSWKHEPLKFRLADSCYYTPDFFVVTEKTLEFHEVKGFWRDDARVKWKAVAEMHQWARWCAVSRKKGIWVYEWY